VRAGHPVSASVRTCIGCRRRAPAGELVRIVLEGTQPLFGSRGGRPGRGASLHPRSDCLAAALKSRALGRAFRRPVDEPQPADSAALARQIEVAYLSQQPRSG
jgi:uncharacterized protein